MLSTFSNNDSTRNELIAIAQSRRAYLHWLNLRRLKIHYDTTHVCVVSPSSPEDGGDHESR